MNTKMLQRLFVGLLVVLLTGCATKVRRVDVGDRIDLSGGWNDYDAMLVAEEMVKDSLAESWLDRFYKVKGRDPVIIVGQVKNQTNEHISPAVFVKYLERELTNSGKVSFVASAQERDPVRDERQDQQQGFTDPETVKAMGKEHGADFMLAGSIESIVDPGKARSVVFYQVNLELIDLETNVKVWMGQKQIKKDVLRPRLSL